MKALIADDEFNGRELLRELLLKIEPRITDIALADDVGTAVDGINENEPDIVFLDIQMTSGTGFDVLEAVNSRNFEVIFVTAYENYAIEAFKFAAIDYLVKPINVENLRAAVLRAIDNRRMKASEERLSALLDNIKPGRKESSKIALPTLKGFEMHDVQNISHCRSEGNYTRFHMSDGASVLVSRTMKDFEAILERNGFLRIHRSSIVNLEHVKQYIKGKGGEVIMKSGEVLDVSRNKRDELLEALT